MIELKNIINTIATSINPISTGYPTTSGNSWTYNIGSLGYELSSMIDDKISYITTENASTYKPIFSTINHSTPSYIRNTNCWAYGIDLTPISVWNSTSGTGARMGTLISPRHVAFATHYTPDIGATMRFVTSDNTIVTRTLTAKSVGIGNWSYDTYGWSEICIGLLDSDVPSSISFAYMASPRATRELYLSNGSTLRVPIPILYVDQASNALVGSTNLLNKIITSPNWYCDMDISDSVIYPHRYALWEEAVGGDSGCPWCLVASNKLILITTNTNVAEEGEDWSYYINEINAAMTALGGGYQVTEFDYASNFAQVDTSMYVYNNTLFGNVTYGGIVQPTYYGVLGSWINIDDKMCYCRNNLVITNGTYSVDACNTNTDYNCYYDLTGNYKFRRWNNSGGEWEYTSLADWQAATGMDTHSFIADPQLKSTIDYHLKKTSPCIDTGVNLSEITYDYENNPRPMGSGIDIGAYEYFSSKVMNSILKNTILK